MFHPWRHLGQHLQDWTLRFAPLPGERIGVTDYATKTITLAPGMTQAQRRCTIAHECVHAERGPARSAFEVAREERIANEQAARRLIPLADLVEALRWTSCPHELADELWVDVDTLQMRVKHLHPSELARIREALAEHPSH